ncbi:uncharacterized protein [Ptychodera flava]|uniref:uncharacterized protein n=1 Tax=Ptychodera flava TaxID=63121 RepID=UPI00396A84E9
MYRLKDSYSKVTSQLIGDPPTLDSGQVQTTKSADIWYNLQCEFPKTTLFIAQCLVFLACLLSTCESTPKDYQRQQLLPVPPPPQSTESSDQFIDIFNKILQGFQDKDPGNFDGMNWYFGDTTDPVPEIPKLPQPHEELEDLPKYLPTFEPRDAWQKTAVPTVYIDGSFYNSTVTSSSFIAVAIAMLSSSSSALLSPSTPSKPERGASLS